ncbi:cation:proton antiporter [Zooshikella sp. RANM57]|uniref:cation:proton antiporter domain-containing protein n=1 Tax=Zooshikella sp. RANM57 TaxID=3425863 RepID=UPI003D6F0FCA
MDFSLLNQLLVIFICSVVAIAVFHRLRLPATLSYLIVGVLLGPAATDTIAESENIALLAEMGVVFLLFSIGLEFSFAHMWALRRIVFGLGGNQVLLCGIGIAIIAFILGLPLPIALILGAGLALSSTAIVSKELTSRNELKLPIGQQTMGILIFQDIAAVFFLILIPVLAGNSEQNLWVALGTVLVKSTLLLVTMLLIGRWILPHLFHEIAKVRSEELFVLTALVIALLAAWVTHSMHLSMALGGFLAGMMLGESHYRHQVEHDIRPFRDVLLGLFFVSVGMMLDLSLFLQHWLLILLLTTLLLVFKASIITWLARKHSDAPGTALKTGLYLAQGGEFCLALIALVNQHDLLTNTQSAVVLSVTILSMSATPFIIRYSHWFIHKLSSQKTPTTQSEPNAIAAALESVTNHTLICGYGRVGQSIGRFLDKQNLPYVAMDDDPVRVKEACQAERKVFFGDCRRPDLLEAAGLDRANLVVICVDVNENAEKITQAIRLKNQQIPIIVRTRDDTSLEALRHAGATEVIPEIFESSLMMIKHVLVMLGTPSEQIREQIDAVRQERYQMLHGLYQGERTSIIDKKGLPRTFLHGIQLPTDASSLGKTLEFVDLESRCGIEIHHLKRHDMELDDWRNQPLLVNDIVVISGNHEQLEQAENLLLTGYS